MAPRGPERGRAGQGPGENDLAEEERKRRWGDAMHLRAAQRTDDDGGGGRWPGCGPPPFPPLGPWAGGGERARPIPRLWDDRSGGGGLPPHYEKTENQDLGCVGGPSLPPEPETRRRRRLFLRRDDGSCGKSPKEECMKVRGSPGWTGCPLQTPLSTFR